MSYTNTGMWTLEKWCRGTHLQSRSRDTDIENKREDSKEEKEGWDELGDWGGHTHTHTLFCVSEKTHENLPGSTGSPAQRSAGTRTGSGSDKEGYTHSRLTSLHGRSQLSIVKQPYSKKN